MIGGGIFIQPIMAARSIAGNLSIAVIDTFLPEDYKKYRKKLEKLARYAEEHTKSKYISSAKSISKIVEDLPIKTPIISLISSAVSLESPIPTFEVHDINKEILSAISYLEERIRNYEEMLGEEEEAFIIMLSLI